MSFRILADRGCGGGIEEFPMHRLMTQHTTVSVKVTTLGWITIAEPTTILNHSKLYEREDDPDFDEINEEATETVNRLFEELWELPIVRMLRNKARKTSSFRNLAIALRDRHFVESMSMQTNHRTSHDE